MRFLLIHPDGGNGVRNAQENKVKLENAFLSDSRCPAKVIAFNFTRPLGGGLQSAPKAVCDIYIEKYLNEPGKFEEGSVIKSKPIHSVINAKGEIRGNPLITPELRRISKGVFKPRSTNKIDKFHINDICKRRGLLYRLYSIRNKAKTTRTGIFWHPEYGYGSAELKHWLKSPEAKDPFRNIISGRDKINRAKLIVFDNYLQDRIEILNEPPIYPKGVARILVFCKEHGVKTSATMQNIEKGLWFNCPDCTRSDFENIRNIYRLRSGDKKDLGSTVVGLMHLKVNGVETLKFGITSSRLSSLSNEELLYRRYRKQLIKVHDAHRCQTELEAREFEQRMLIATNSLKNTNVSRKFAGYTECRIFGSRPLELCRRAFSDVVQGVLED
jgi:hypothetical protein